MKDFGSFCKEVLKRCFSGLFWLADAFGLILLIASKSQPRVPWQLSLAIFAVTVFAACFDVWRNQKRKTLKVTKQLNDLRNSIPSYAIELGEIKKYTVKPLIDKYQEIVDSYKPVPSPENGTTMDLGVFHGITSVIESVKTMAESIAPMIKAAGFESSEDRQERLNEHLSHLKSFEKDIENIYQVGISIKSTRADKNIEITVNSSDIEEMIVGDSHVTKKVPHTHKPQSGYSGLLGMAHDYGVHLQSRLYLSSYGNANGAFSKLSNLNAQRELRLFDEDYFVRTNSKKPKITFLIHSEGRIEPQNIEIELDLSQVVIESLDENKEDD